MEILNSLYLYADYKNILVRGVELDYKISFCMSESGFEGIGIDYNKIKTISQEKSILAEELAHLHYGLTYKLTDFNNPVGKQNIERCECQAKYHAAVALVPFDDLASAVSHGITEIWDLAEYFNVSENEIKKAIECYRVQFRL